MKINSIQNYNTPNKNTNKNHQKPSFAARVNVIWESTKDVISGDYIALTKEPLRTLVEKVRPALEKIMDDNLIIDVTGAGRPSSIWNMFKAPVEGLKFDLSFFDIKKYYYEVLMKEKQLDRFVAPQHYEGLMKKDSTLLYSLRERVGVGRLYTPQKGDTPEIFIKDIVPKIKEHLKLFPKLVTERKDFRYNPETKQFDIMGAVFPCGERRPWEHYRGIEYDYPPIFQELYK